MTVSEQAVEAATNAIIADYLARGTARFQPLTDEEMQQARAEHETYRPYAERDARVALTAALPLVGVMRREDVPEGHDEPCYYCGKPCNSLAGNPGEWPICLSHRDDPGVAKWHHASCVTERLIENQPLMRREDVARAREELERAEHFVIRDSNGNEVAEDSLFETRKSVKRALAILALPHTGQPQEGWVLVPKEPTPKMLNAMIEAYTARVGDTLGSMYARMHQAALSAAPASPHVHERETPVVKPIGQEK